MKNTYLSNRRLPSSYLGLVSKLDKKAIGESIIKQIVSHPPKQYEGAGIVSLEITCLYIEFLFINIVHENDTIKITDEEKETWNTILSKSDYRFTKIKKTGLSELVKITSLHRDITENLYPISLEEITTILKQEIGNAVHRQEKLPSPFRQMIVNPNKLGSGMEPWFTSFLDKNGKY